MFLFVTLAWVPFRARDAGHTLAILRGFFGAAEGRVTYVPAFLLLLAPVVAFGHAVIESLSGPRRPAWIQRLQGALDIELVTSPISGRYVVLGAGTVAGSFVAAAWVLLAFSLASFGSHPFIYFQF
ncbi:MAG: hypothetical protein JOZ69_12405 [Myxococcales bacterium]|nr:hypothetical protein [Myxococcales bacterium]